MTQALFGYAVTQLLCEDEQFVLLRAVREADGAPVLLRRTREGRRDSLERLEHEYALRAELDPAWSAAPLALAGAGASLTLVLADGGALPLLPTPGVPMASAAFLATAAALAAAVAQLHRHDIVHKDLRPEHILIDAAGKVRLTGFGIAARLNAVPRGPDRHQSGSLAYMAPEQSGRVDRAIDTRTDLYSLGVVLYQALCGSLPFAAGDPMQWIYCHVARPAPPPASACPDADPACAAIVMKLLEKSAEQRYQSAAGLLADLQHCQAALAAQGAIAPFALGRSDAVARLRLADLLVGRAADLAVLEEAALHVAAGGAPQLIMLSGPPGSGKSALLAALQQSDALAGAIVVAGKFEQHQVDIPYAALAQAFQKVVRQMRAQSAAALANWRRSLLAALGGNAALMLELIPELDAVIGLHPAPPPLPAREAEGRLQATFRQLLGALSGADSMLLLCMDDLQWIDPASLKLLSHLVAHADVRHVLAVGAYRASEVGPEHRLALAHESMRRQGAAVRRVQLQPLSAGQAEQLVAAALDCPASRCAPLAALVFAKTGGNPFFTLQFLTRLAESGLLRYEHAGERWTWDGEAIGAKQFSDNVVDLMVARLQQLPYNTLELVKLLACLGPHASIATLAQVAGMSAPETDECLWPAARLGLVKREPHAFRFTHDRVMEAAYSLHCRHSLPERHLHIGRALLAPGAQGDGDGGGSEHGEYGEHGEHVFAVVAHLNRARPAMHDPAELRALAELNAAAGAKARRGVAYDAARHYFELAAALTPDSGWQDDPDATFTLYSALAEAEYLCGRLERADELFALLAGHAGTRLALGRVALMRVALYQMVGRFDQAVAVSLEALALFGVTFAPEDGDIDTAVARERADIAAAMAGRAAHHLAHAPLSTDPEIILVSALLADMGSSVFSARPQLYALLAAKALNFTLRCGRTDSSSSTFSRYAILLVSLGAVDEAFAFSELAQALATSDGPAASRSGRMTFVHGAYIHCWRRPLAASVPLLEQAFAACLEAGDLPHAGYAAHIATWNSYEAGAALAAVQQRARHYQGFARQQNNEVLMQLLRCYEQLTLCLQGATGGEGSFDDALFCARDALALIERANYGAAKARYHLLRQVAAYTFGQYDEALLAAQAAAGDQQFFLASVHESTHHFYHALTLAALHDGLPAARRLDAMDALLDKQERLRAAAQECPLNFENRHLLVTAEVDRIGGRDLAAMRGYDAALASAVAGGFVHHQALAAELAARFYSARGFDTIALAYARTALQACARWGAYGKMRQLERRFPALSPAPPEEGRAGSSGAAPQLLAALRAAQALAGAADPVLLAATMLRSAAEQAGATAALLLVRTGQGVRCVAQAGAGAAGVAVESCDRPAAGAALPYAMLQSVLRTHQTVLLDDALASGKYCNDSHVVQARARSVLCIALLAQGVASGVLYLENTQQAGVFTADKVLMLELLAAHGAAAFDNLRLARQVADDKGRRRAQEAAREQAEADRIGERG